MITAPSTIRPDIVTMHSEVECRDEVTGDVRRTTLVYPGKEDFENATCRRDTLPSS
jgi:regulator of nucleoside diphosphate kinase